MPPAAWSQTGGLACQAPAIAANGELAAHFPRRWWDRDVKDETNDPNDRYDKGAPDFQAPSVPKLRGQ